jgi:hypothetical protein
MTAAAYVFWIAVVLVVVKAVAQLWLDRLNETHVR